MRRVEAKLDISHLKTTTKNRLLSVLFFHVLTQVVEATDNCSTHGAEFDGNLYKTKRSHEQTRMTTALVYPLRMNSSFLKSALSTTGKTATNQKTGHKRYLLDK